MKEYYAVENHPNDSRVNMNNPGTVQTLSSRMGTGGCNVPIVLELDGKQGFVRYLTPVECARLQGFPDWWTDGADGSDSAKYKLWGNGIALPCAEDVMGRVAKALREDETNHPKG